MEDQAAPKSAEPAEAYRDPRDILARLYREIGISAVAAALQVTAPRSPALDGTNEETFAASTRSNGLAA